MLELKEIRKTYMAGSTAVEALRGIDLKFRESEFVSVLGPSGCGKTTLLNIIGGLDRFTSGDLVINGKSTTKFRDKDWDAYRNNSIGFVFQTYNLIAHQSVIANVELALTLSGISKGERRRLAADVLARVGLEDQIHKKPNQLSGGQMQRVAIARALINNPDILLADEPTGALDSETSVQIMELLREIAGGKLVIMVTHNPELAEKYSTRIIKLLDGKVISDSNPYVEPDANAKTFSMKRTTMSFLTALGLSVSNLLTKKARTLLTSFAGSIGIIGIALVLSLQNGLQTYITNTERDTLSAYPITIEKEAMDVGGLLTSMMGGRPDGGEERDPDKIYVNTLMMKMINTMTSQIKSNDLKAFKAYIDERMDEVAEYTTAVKYNYSVDRNLYHYTAEGTWFRVNPSSVFTEMYSQMYGIDMSSVQQSGGMMVGMGATSSFQNADLWHVLMPNEDFLRAQYDVVEGKLPESAFEAVLIVSEENTIPDLMLYSLGIKGQAELDTMVNAVMNGETLETGVEPLSYSDVIGLEYAIMLPTDYYDEQNGEWIDRSEDQAFVAAKLAAAPRVRIVGILRPNEDAAAVSQNTEIGLTKELDEYLIAQIAESEIVKQQLANPVIDVFTGKPFKLDAPAFGSLDEFIDMVNSQVEAAVAAQIASIETLRGYGVPDAQIVGIVLGFGGMSLGQDAFAIRTVDELVGYITEQSKAMAEEQLGYIEQMRAAGMKDDEIFDLVVSAMMESSATYESNLEKLQYRTADNPTSIDIYASSFENKDKVEDLIAGFNASRPEGEGITYTDFIGIMLNSISTIINAISIVLIAFVSISLVVSSIMIGIITYISVLERTREIGILRAIGASKKDISRVFNAETLFIGFAAGLLGIIITALIDIPANVIIAKLTGITQNLAVLPVTGAVALVLISMLLTFIAGLIPSRVAAKKDPVVALRTE
ncbi:MAG: ABC transporter ATP-binding protein/permease [Oscillospiraceae bacterium]|jgi:putative ABC transport system permease protein|nr:ABC transporter ATP-binding protein/permease [Oscillospiraceae bacterium]